MDIKISDEQMQSIVSAAVLQAMGTEARDTVMKAAIEYLLTPKSDDRYSYSKPKSPLQRAFENAIEVYAMGAAREWLEEREDARQQIRDLYVAAYQKMVTDYQPDLIDRIAQQMARALSGG